MNKFSLAELVEAHRRTYVDANTGLVRGWDIFDFEVFPSALAVLLCFTGIRFSDAMATALLAAGAILAALLFGAMLQVSQRAMDWADTKPTPSITTSEHANFLEELAANTGYASLVCIVAAGIYLIVLLIPDTNWYRVPASALSTGITIHLAFVLLMVMRRIFELTRGRLDRARTGADIGRRAS